MKVLFFSSTRADYSLLYPSMNLIKKEKNLHLQIIISGSHLDKKFGLSENIIINDGFKINKKIKFESKNHDIVNLFSNSSIQYNKAIKELNPDLVILLGDRFETLSFALVCFFNKIPIAHLHGGEQSSGSYDDTFRHMITKLSNLHFTSSNDHKNRVIQLGERPKYVYNSGAFGLEYLKNFKFYYNTIEKKYNFDFNKKFFLVTYHPVTIGKENPSITFKNIISACETFKDYLVVITYPNIDLSSKEIIKQIENNDVSKNIKIYKNLGRVCYPHFLSKCQVAIGNSSSAIIEAPYFKIPTVNVGIRQNNRSKAQSIIDTTTDKQSIINSIKLALSKSFKNKLKKTKNVYDVKKSSEILLKNIKKRKFNYIKSFYDIIS